MKTELQKELAKIAPNIHIQTIWEHDPDAWSEWRELSKPGNCFENESRDDWQPWQSEVRATVICDGEEVTGSAYLGCTWEKAGDDPSVSNPDISGYEPQMTEEALQELQNALPIVGISGSARALREQVHNAIAHLSTLN